jgi:hypothetical protein
LNLPVSTTQQALLLFGARASKFEDDYRAAILGVTRRVPNVTVCSVYNGNFPDDQAPSTRVALMLFNDAILRVAKRRCVPLTRLPDSGLKQTRISLRQTRAASPATVGGRRETRPVLAVRGCVTIVSMCLALIAGSARGATVALRFSAP